MSEAKEKTSLESVLRSLSPVVGSIGVTYTEQREDTWGGKDEGRNSPCEVSTHVNTLPQPPLRFKTHRLQTNMISV